VVQSQLYRDPVVVSRRQRPAALDQLLADAFEGLPFLVGKVLGTLGFLRNHPIEGLELHLIERFVLVLLPPAFGLLLGAEKLSRIPRALGLSAGIVRNAGPEAIGLELIVNNHLADAANGFIMAIARQGVRGGHAIALVFPTLDEKGKRLRSEPPQFGKSATDL